MKNHVMTRFWSHWKEIEQVAVVQDGLDGARIITVLSLPFCIRLGHGRTKKHAVVDHRKFRPK